MIEIYRFLLMCVECSNKQPVSFSEREVAVESEVNKVVNSMGWTSDPDYCPLCLQKNANNELKLV